MNGVHPPMRMLHEGARALLADVQCSRNTGAGAFNEQREAMWTKFPHLLLSMMSPFWGHFCSVYPTARMV